MAVLVDTHVFIWFFDDSPRLSSSMRLFMEKSGRLAISIASFWEITIKVSLGKLVIDGSIADVIDKALASGFEILPIQREHLEIKIVSLRL